MMGCDGSKLGAVGSNLNDDGGSKRVVVSRNGLGQCNLMEAVEKARNHVEQAGSGKEQARVIGHHLRISTHMERIYLI